MLVFTEQLAAHARHGIVHQYRTFTKGIVNLRAQWPPSLALGLAAFIKLDEEAHTTNDFHMM